MKILFHMMSKRSKDFGYPKGLIEAFDKRIKLNMSQPEVPLALRRIKTN